LADEPTGELDRESAAQVHDLLVAVCQAQGSALLLVSHDTQAVRIVDRVVRVRDGRLSEEWRPGDAGTESLVVDDRGWVRLPEQLRRRVGVGARVHASAAGATIVLRDPINQTATDEPPPAPPAQIVHNGLIATLTDVTVDRDGRRILDGQSLDVHGGAL